MAKILIQGDRPELCSNPDLAIGALVVGAPGAIANVASALPGTVPTIPVTFSPADEQVGRIRTLLAVRIRYSLIETTAMIDGQYT